VYEDTKYSSHVQGIPRDYLFLGFMSGDASEELSFEVPRWLARKLTMPTYYKLLGIIET